MFNGSKLKLRAIIAPEKDFYTAGMIHPVLIAIALWDASVIYIADNSCLVKH